MTGYARLRIDAPVRLDAIVAAVQTLGARGVPKHARIQIGEESTMPGIAMLAFW